MSEIERAIDAIKIGMIHEQEIQGWIFHTVRREPLLIAIEALREKAKREKGCEYCNGAVPLASTVDSLQRGGSVFISEDRLVLDMPNDYLTIKINYCPMCGRKLKGEQNDRN